MTLDITEEVATRLREGLPACAVRWPVPDDVRDPRGRTGVRPTMVLTPGSTEEVATIVRTCAKVGAAIVPRGGGTGLVLGQFTTNGPAPVIVSMERMTAIRAVHPDDNVLIAEAGAVLADVQKAAEDADRLFPLSLASEGSCRIGGNLATNAGGLNVLRYGNARELCLGLEAVLPDGSVWHGLKRLRKDNTGYDLRNLLIGAEGTLGIITAAALRLFPRPEQEGTALLVVPSPKAALDLLMLARRIFAETISAFELIDATGQRLLREMMPDVRLPFETIPDWCVLLSVGTPEALSPQIGFERLFEAALEARLASDGMVAQSASQAAELWRVRESIPEAIRLVGTAIHHDISLPVSAISDFLAKASEALTAYANVRINVFGHLGDGNLHFNVIPAQNCQQEAYRAPMEEITRLVHDLVHTFEGSFSAEHGVGRMKVTELERYGNPARLAAMRAIKRALDPKGIMNPGAVLR